MQQVMISMIRCMLIKFVSPLIHCLHQLRPNYNAVISGGLMADTHINRSGLLSAISAYQSQYVQKAKREYRGCNIHKDIYGWSYFSDTAFNYRPYQ